METERLYYLGVVKKVVVDDDKKITKEYGIIEADIPGVIQGITAFPKRTEIDEPKPGDTILLLCLDPVLNSYWIYEKLKENEFIGIRSAGKMIDITPEKIRIGIFDKDQTYFDGAAPTLTSYVEIDESGNITVNAEKDVEVNVSGDSYIETEGNTTIKSKGECVIDSPEVTVTGGNLTINGQVNPTPGNGPFCALPVCMYSGGTHTGNRVTGT